MRDEWNGIVENRQQVEDVTYHLANFGSGGKNGVVCPSHNFIGFLDVLVGERFTLIVS